MEDNNVNVQPPVVEPQKKKSNTGLIVFLIILVLGLAGYICYDKILNKTSVEIKKDCNCDNKNERSECVCEECNETVKTSETRTYRFFGYESDKDPDMYTTLKLYSNGNYDFYINKCSSIERKSGKYEETSNTISLTGDFEYTFKKIDNGNSLEYDFEQIISCVESGGNFSLESYMLNPSTIENNY